MAKKKNNSGLTPGPPLAAMMRRIAETPEDFLRVPRSGNKSPEKGAVDVEAVVSDLLFDTGGAFPGEEERAAFRLLPDGQNRGYLHLVLILCYLLHDSAFTANALYAKKMLSFLKSEHLKKLVKIIKPEDFISDPERREELARLTLRGLGLLPEGENENTAKDRLSTIDSVEQKRIIQKSRRSLERARKLREEMARKEAEEAASKAMRE